LGNGFLDVVDPVVVRVVDADEMDALIAALEGFGLVEQHADPHFLQPRDHADRVVVAEHPEDRPRDLCAHPRQSLEGRREGPERPPAIVAGQHADIVGQAREQLDQALHRPLVHVDVQVANLQDGETVERGRQLGQYDVVVPDLDPLGVLPGTPIQPGQF